jgi:CDP-2,3-bis-(O-geranylgeranyl)-sn-glycerol synthase
MLEGLALFIVNGFIKTIPIILSNISPVLTAKLLPRLDYPVDFNKKLWDNKRLFGSHKTWRGVITMILVALLFGYFTVGINYSLLVGIGVVIGDLLTSLIKRRINLKPGASFQPYESFLLIFSVFLIAWGLFNIYEIIVITLLVVPVYKGFHYLGYWLKLKDKPW